MAISTAMASHLTLVSLLLKTLTLFAAKPACISLTSSPLRAGLICMASSGFRGLSRLMLVMNIAISPEFEQDDEVLKGDENGDFLPGLKLFVGNLPFSIDSPQLAELFKRVHNVKMVEV